MADTLTLADEDLPGTPMLRPYLRSGEPVGEAGENLHDLEAICRHAAAELASLGGAGAILQRRPYLTVQPSQRLQDLVEQTGARLRSLFSRGHRRIGRAAAVWFVPWRPLAHHVSGERLLANPFPD